MTPETFDQKYKRLTNQRIDYVYKFTDTIWVTKINACHENISVVTFNTKAQCNEAFKKLIEDNLLVNKCDMCETFNDVKIGRALPNGGTLETYRCSDCWERAIDRI